MLSMFATANSFCNKRARTIPAFNWLTASSCVTVVEFKYRWRNGAGRWRHGAMKFKIKAIEDAISKSCFMVEDITVYC